MELVYKILEIPSNSSEILNFYALKNVYFRTRIFILAHKKLIVLSRGGVGDGPACVHLITLISH